MENYGLGHYGKISFQRTLMPEKKSNLSQMLGMKSYKIGYLYDKLLINE